MPVAAKPVQTPRLVSAGLAFSPYEHTPDYSSTSPRQRRLFFEFDRKPDDPQDRYYVRFLASAPDPLLINFGIERIPEPDEPALPTEPIRVITHGQAQDTAGLDDMQELNQADETGKRFLVPLSQGLDENSLELFSVFTYELCAGHNGERWSIAPALHGPPLRVAGVQHPAPPLACQAGRTRHGILVSAPFATPVYQGQSYRPLPPRSDLWVLLYAQVEQFDGNAWRNVLLGHRRAHWRPPQDLNQDLDRSPNLLELGVAGFDQSEVSSILESLGLPRTAPLSVLAVELLPEPMRGPDMPPRLDPLGRFLGDVRILRTSQLTPLGEICELHLGG